MFTPIHIPDRPESVYLAATLLLAAAVPLVISIRAVTIAHVDPVRAVVPAYVSLMIVLTVAGAALDPSALATALTTSVASSSLLGLVAVPFAWWLDRALVTLPRRRSRGPTAATYRTGPSPLAPILSAGAPLTIAGGCLEEIMYRYLVIGLTATAVGSSLLAATVATLSYALVHAGFGWTQVLAKGALGIFFVALLAVSGGLVAPMLAHAGFNAVAMWALRHSPAGSLVVGRRP